LLSAFAAPEVVRDYTGWLDEEKRLSNRAYFIIDKQGIVRFKKVGEMVPIQELEQVLVGLE
jgi:alkyl hydroperoxide reductase subunit AhpC